MTDETPIQTIDEDAPRQRFVRARRQGERPVWIAPPTAIDAADGVTTTPLPTVWPRVLPGL